MNKNKTFGVIGVCGANGNLIARILKHEDVISSSKYFLVLVKLYGYSSKLKAGLYEFNKNGEMEIYNK